MPKDAYRLVKRLRSRGTEPVALVNTHWHTDHTVGNSLYDCPIWCQTLGPRYLKRYWPSWVGSPRDKRAGGLRLKLPDRRFVRRASLDLDGEEVQLIHIPGHTPDSIGVFAPDRGVFIAGDAVMELPFISFGNSLDSIRSLRRIQHLRPRMIVQGHGPPCFSARLTKDIQYLEKIRKAAREARLSGVSQKSFLELPLEEFIPLSRARTFGKGYRGAHRSNLRTVWSEAPRIRR